MSRTTAISVPLLQYRRFGSERLNMSVDTALRAIDFLLENSAGRKRVEVDFFGGEPLLNLPVGKRAVAYGRNGPLIKRIRFIDNQWDAVG